MLRKKFQVFLKMFKLCRTRTKAVYNISRFEEKFKLLLRHIDFNVVKNKCMGSAGYALTWRVNSKDCRVLVTPVKLTWFKGHFKKPLFFIFACSKQNSAFLLTKVLASEVPTIL